jgi:hypothetical protein
MRKTLLAVTTAAAMAFSAPAFAQSGPNHVAPAAGVVAGTVAGVGLYNHWWGNGAFTGLGATVGGSIAGGVLVGVAVATGIDAATTKCRGLHALAGGSGCVDGQFVGHRY